MLGDPFRQQQLLPIIEAMKAILEQLMELTTQLTDLVVQLVRLLHGS